MSQLAPNKHIIFIRFSHWDAYSLAGASRKYSQQACAPYVKRYAHMKNLALFILISFSASAEEVEFSSIFGNNDYLNKQIELMGFLSAAPTQASINSNETSMLPIAYFHASEEALASGDKKVLFFDWPSELCHKNNCANYLDKTLKVKCEIRYLSQPVNFHSVTNIVNIEVLND
ncbi:hypothetical protein [Alteromonas lipotrueae]|uniref:hypothetical protein n=2 Tax=Alteromonas TaxID=226 RepID=UPI001C444BDC|nr:hypothetical protein [Alteromonas lipotrueae]